MSQKVFFKYCQWTLSNSAPTPTHPHSSPPTPTHPKYFPNHLHPLKIMSTNHHSPTSTQNNTSYTSIHPHLPKTMPHPLPRTQNNPYSLKIIPTNCHSHKILSSNPHLLKLLFDHEIRKGRHSIKVVVILSKSSSYYQS